MTELLTDEAAPLAALDVTFVAASRPFSDTLPTAEARIAAPATVARAHVTKPWAVSRKNTSSVWVPTHFVLSRPVMYPPSAADSHCTTINQMAVITLKVVAEAPL